MHAGRGKLESVGQSRRNFGLFCADDIEYCISDVLFDISDAEYYKKISVFDVAFDITVDSRSFSKLRSDFLNVRLAPLT